MKYFSATDTLNTIAEKYPETIPVFVGNGFPQMGDPAGRAGMGSRITLAAALKIKRRNLDTFTKLLIDRIESSRNEIDATLRNTEVEKDHDGPSVVGILPCPVRIPLLEGFTGFAKQYARDFGKEIRYDFKAASMGTAWIAENIQGIDSEADLPDLFISAGFELFFDEHRIGGMKKRGVFRDYTKIDAYNSLFQKIDLRDPRRHFAMIGVVPGVFLVNTDLLNGRKRPESWADILTPEFERAVSLPVQDFDLFNGILLTIHKLYGDSGVRKLGKSLLESLHPSQMIKSEKKKQSQPVVTIMPYFFTKMLQPGSALQAVWPEEGAIISPIFMLAKHSRQMELQPVVDYFSSREVGEILALQGLFPSVHPDVDNGIPAENSFLWLGWDYIYSNDIPNLIQHCTKVFNTSEKDPER